MSLRACGTLRYGATLNADVLRSWFRARSDFHGRSVTLTPALGSDGTVATDTLQAPGFGKSLTWTINWRNYVSTGQTYYVEGSCTIVGGCTAAPGGVFVSNIQLPSVNGETLQYQFGYAVGTASTTGWDELNSVTTPYGAGITYQYSSEGATRGQYTENSRIAQKTLTWTDPLGNPRSQVWAFIPSGSLGLTQPQYLAVNGPDTSPTAAPFASGNTTYTFCYLPTQGYPAGKIEICNIQAPNGDTTVRTWHRNCPYGLWSAEDAAFPGNPYVATETKTIGGGALTSTRNYSYDRNGNLLTTAEYDWNASSPTRTTTNAFAVVPGAAEIAYDFLNRVTGKTYQDSTPPVTYCYDSLTSPSGCSFSPTGSLLIDRLTMVYSSASTSLLSAYDAVGNVLSSQQITGGQTYSPFTYTYNKLGEITSQTYPSGRKVATAYDAAGRPASVQNGTTLAYYANPVSYAPNGSTTSVTLGNKAQTFRSLTIAACVYAGEERWHEDAKAPSCRTAPTGLGRRPIQGFQSGKSRRRRYRIEIRRGNVRFHPRCG
jgi:YD repeat-containing protein